MRLSYVLFTKQLQMLVFCHLRHNLCAISEVGLPLSNASVHTRKIARIAGDKKRVVDCTYNWILPRFMNIQSFLYGKLAPSKEDVQI